MAAASSSLASSSSSASTSSSGDMQWRQVQPGVYQRPCTGQEHSASFNQNIADGHTELSLALTFTTTVATDELIERVRLAWLASRVSHPEAAIELSTGTERPQMMTYRVLHDGDAELDAWLASTLVICAPTQSHDDVMRMTYNRRLPTKGKQSMMYFVPSSNPTGATPHCFVWNVAHAITDAFSLIAFLNDFMEEVMLAEVGAPARFSDRPEEGVRNLPASLIHAYQQRFQPSEQDKQESIATARSQVALYAQKLDRSVAMEPRADHLHRPHGTHCLFDVLSASESRAILANLQRNKMSITFAGAAATILAVRDMYARGNEQGALLGMTRNARRWVDTTGRTDGSQTIPMATDVVFLWIPFEGRDGDDGVLPLARRIRQELAPHLRSPHYMASMQLMCDEFVDGLANGLELEAAASNATSASSTPPLIPRSPPGFSPQGLLPLLRRVTSRDGRHTLDRITLHHTGRQVNASPWIGLFSLDDELHVSLGFDEKYYDRPAMDAFFARYRAYLRGVAQGTTTALDANGSPSDATVHAAAKL